MRKTLVATIAVIGLAGAGTAMTAENASVVSDASPASSGAVSSSEVLVGETWGFEAGEGFVPGAVEGQVGWTISPASTAEPHIDTANPHAGAQHLRISRDPGIDSAYWTEAFSPYVQDTVPDASTVSVWVAIGATGGAEYDVRLWDSSAASRTTAEVLFEDDGSILVHSDTGCCVDTGFDWVPGVYVRLVINVDPITDTITYWYGGDQIYSSVVFDGTAVEQVFLSRYNVQSAEHGDFDDLVIDRGLVVPPALHHWSFESDGSDSVGGADAVLHNGASIAGGALVLDGVDGYAELPIAATLSSLTDVSVEMWVTWAGDRSWERFFDFGTGTAVNWFMTPSASQTGKPRVAITTGGNPGEQSTDAPDWFPSDTRTHVVFTLDGDGASNQSRLYIDGALVAGQSFASPLDPAELGALTNIWLGRSQYESDPYLEGSIDELILYGGVLGDLQVLERYRDIFTDGFESGVTSAWSRAVP